MARRILRAASTAALLCVAACGGASFALDDAGSGGTNAGDGGSTPVEGGGSVTMDQACTDLATSLCTRLGSCATILVPVEFGDMATCVARGKLSCATSFAANGTGLTTNAAESCAQAYGGASCDDLLGNKLPSACI